MKKLERWISIMIVLEFLFLSITFYLIEPTIVPILVLLVAHILIATLVVFFPRLGIEIVWFISGLLLLTLITVFLPVTLLVILIGLPIIILFLLSTWVIILKNRETAQKGALGNSYVVFDFTIRAAFLATIAICYIEIEYSLLTPIYFNTYFFYLINLWVVLFCLTKIKKTRTLFVFLQTIPLFILGEQILFNDLEIKHSATFYVALVLQIFAYLVSIHHLLLSNIRTIRLLVGLATAFSILILGSFYIESETFEETFLFDHELIKMIQSNDPRLKEGKYEKRLDRLEKDTYVIELTSTYLDDFTKLLIKHDIYLLEPEKFEQIQKDDMYMVVKVTATSRNIERLKEEIHSTIPYVRFLHLTETQDIPKLLDIYDDTPYFSQ